MTTILLCTLVGVGVMMFGLSIGTIFRGRCLRGSCGGSGGCSGCKGKRSAAL